MVQSVHPLTWAHFVTKSQNDFRYGKYKVKVKLNIVSHKLPEAVYSRQLIDNLSDFTKW